MNSKYIVINNNDRIRMIIMFNPYGFSYKFYNRVCQMKL